LDFQLSQHNFRKLPFRGASLDLPGMMPHLPWDAGILLEQSQQVDTHNLEFIYQDRALASLQDIIRSECGPPLTTAEYFLLTKRAPISVGTKGVSIAFSLEQRKETTTNRAIHAECSFSTT